MAGQLLGGGRFQLKQILGQGGMGQVWLAQDLRLGEEEALKVLPPEIRHNPESLDDLRRETLKSRKLAHPNIVRLHDLHEFPDDGRLALLSAEGDLEYGFAGQVPNKTVHSVGFAADGALVIVGAFTSVGDQPRLGVARLNTPHGRAAW